MVASIDLIQGENKLDSFLQFNQRAILEHRGKISMEKFSLAAGQPVYPGVAKGIVAAQMN